jgi:cyclophilin family peptidyl-prolyl cis-trans isomerase
MTRHRSVRLAAALLAIPVLLAACTGGSSTPTAAPVTAAPSAAPPAAPTPVAAGAYPDGCPTAQPAALTADDVRNVTIKTDKGDIVVEIKGSLSPIATGNFVALAECGYYDGVVFHRVVTEPTPFVIQGGDGQYGRSPNVDPRQVGTGGPPYTIQDEPVTATYGRAVVAMARTPAPNSVGSQFFIVLTDEAREPLQAANTYQIIGTVTSGMEAVDAIAAAADQEIPTNPVPMTSVTVATP